MQNPYFDLMSFLGGQAGVSMPRMLPAEKGLMPQTSTSDQVRTQPVYRTPPSANGGFGGIGGLLGGQMGGAQNYQSFNPFGSQSANIFDQYMRQAMRQYPGSGGFFGFNGYQFPQQQAAPSAAPTYSPATDPWVSGGTIGGGN